MSSENIAIRVSNLSKCYHLYDTPRDRLKQFVVPKLCQAIPVLRKFFPGSPHSPPRTFYKEFWALRNVSFEIKKGETVGIIGRNGSGKSTLLQLLCGTLTPSSGSVEINGRIAALLELGSGFNTEFSGRENIYMNASVLGLSKEEIEARFDDIVAFADIGEFIEQPVKTYSSGMYVRLAFAVIAHVDADILVIDEALAVGDAFFTQKCMRYMRQFMEKGTILFVSHDTEAVKSLCKRALWLEKGQIQSSGTAKNVAESYLQAFYESMQGSGSSAKMRAPTTRIAPVVERKDARLAWVNQTNLRNDIQVFEFNQNAGSFGTKEAEIVSVEIYSEDGNPLMWVVGGEAVTLKILATANQEIHSPIIGFYFKDRLGQILFGENTYLSYCDNPLTVEANSDIETEFSFIMPILPKGDYSVCVAIAKGTNDSHVQLEWIHDTLILKSESSHLATGLVGIPMQKIEIRTIPMANMEERNAY